MGPGAPDLDRFALRRIAPASKRLARIRDVEDPYRIESLRFNPGIILFRIKLYRFCKLTRTKSLLR